jgi:pyruvate kinase
VEESRRLRRTKLICTIGPASRSPEMLEKLVHAGLDVARLNFSHGSHEEHRQVYEAVRDAERRTGKPIAILQDLQGPKIRLGQIEGEMQLAVGDEIRLSSREDFVAANGRFPTTYAYLAKDVRKGEAILLADGRLELTVLGIENEDVVCRVKVGGPVSSRKGINLPGTVTTVPSLTEKDLEDLKFGLALGVDYVALSFVRSPQDLRVLREHMREAGRTVPVISKIEKPQAVECLDAIIAASDGIMVARGDLGVELPPERVPSVQRRAIRSARKQGKLAIVATQMLMSMTRHPRPTHAEVSDVANAVFDGADAVMLSEETAAGSYPEKAVQTMAALAFSAEELPEAYEAPSLSDAIQASHPWAIARAAVMTAHDMNARAIVSYTQQGFGPRLIAHWRPKCQIFGCATTDEEVRRMAFYWGVHPLKILPPDSVEALVASVEQVTIEEGLLHRGDTMVITSKMPFNEQTPTNMLKIHTLLS